MHPVGKFAETYTARYLRRQGYRILERNFRTNYGEIDIIACNRQYIVFIEVKARTSFAHGTALEAISHGKRHRISNTAMLYLQRHPTELQVRFDAAGLLVQQGRFRMKVLEFQYVENADLGEGR